MQEPDFFEEKVISGNKEIYFTMQKIKAGLFTMGYLEERDGEGIYMNRAKPHREVKIPSFYMGKHLVTQELYSLVMSKNPSAFS